MFAFVARQPILDKNKDVFAYELLFRDGKNNCFPETALAPEPPKAPDSNNLKLGLDDISCQKTSFINLKRY